MRAGTNSSETDKPREVKDISFRAERVASSGWLAGWDALRECLHSLAVNEYVVAHLGTLYQNPDPRRLQRHYSRSGPQKFRRRGICGGMRARNGEERKQSGLCGFCEPYIAFIPI